jgi:hypothetical protein
MNEAELQIERTVMVSPARSPIRGRANLRLVASNRKPQRKAALLARRIATTLAALLLLVLVLRFLPPRSRTVDVQATGTTAPASPADLRVSGLQISQQGVGEPLYLDGVVTNAGAGRIKGASADVEFRDLHGNLVGTIETPVTGIAPGGTGAVKGEFMRNPIQPKEMRFFRIAIDQIPPEWNHEVPELKIVSIKAR